MKFRCALNPVDSNFKQAKAGAILTVMGLFIVIGAVNAIGSHIGCSSAYSTVTLEYDTCMQYGVVASFVGVYLYTEGIIQ